MKRFSLRIRRLGEDPVSDWHRCLALFAACLAFVAAVDGALYLSLSREARDAGREAADAALSAMPSAASRFDRAEMERAAREAQATATPRTVSPAAQRDPSI